MDFVNGMRLVVLVLVLVAFAAAHRWGRRRKSKERIAAAALAGLLAIPGASFSIYYAHLFPETAAYFEMRSLRGAELLLIPIGIAGGLIASLLPRAVLMAPMFAATVLAVVPFLKPVFAPLGREELHEQRNGAVTLQSTSATCGPASLSTVMRSIGVDSAEGELARETHSYAGGTEAWYLARAARRRGFGAEFDFRDGFHPEGGLPAVVGVRFGKAGHFIAVLGPADGGFRIGDPLRGEEILSRQELEDRYEFSGFHLRVSARQ